MASFTKRLALSCVVASMGLALLSTPVRADESVPAWAQDPGYRIDELLTAQEDLPSSFDLRDRGAVTPVRLQNPWSSCWAFAGIAAAETSIISDLGAPSVLDLSEKHLAWFAMHPVQPIDDPNQAGEGITVFAEATGGPNEVYIPSNPVLVSTLFSTGVGPVFENDTDALAGFPYRGAEGLTDQDLLTKPELKPLWKAAYRKDLIKEYGSEDAVLAAVLENTPYQSIDEYLDAKYVELGGEADPNSYSSADDWSIPAANEVGESNRNVFVGYTLRDGNLLPSLVAEEGEGYGQDGVQAVKRELMAGHGVSVSFCADTASPGQDGRSEYINTNTWAHYTYKPVNANHSVCIVGWDDDYPAANFTHAVKNMDEGEATQLTTPPGNGAWIAKNSWGCSGGVGTAVNDETQVLGKQDWGVDGSGFFYISYYDKSLLNPESLEFDDDLDEEVVYSNVYDFLPSTDGFYTITGKEVLSTANTFTAEADEQVVSVSTRSIAPNSRVTFALYRLAPDAKGPTDGTLVETQSYDIAYEGFHRFNLTEPFKVRKGQRFSVVSTVSTVGDDGERTYCIAASSAKNEAKAHEDGSPYYGTSVVHEGESSCYVGGAWYDWAVYQTGEEFAENSVGTVVDNFSIKAYGLPWNAADDPDADDNGTATPEPDAESPSREEAKPSSGKKDNAKASTANKGTAETATSASRRSATPSASRNASAPSATSASRGALPSTGDLTCTWPPAILLVSGCALLVMGVHLRDSRRRIR